MQKYLASKMVRTLNWPILERIIFASVSPLIGIGTKDRNLITVNVSYTLDRKSLNQNYLNIKRKEIANDNLGDVFDHLLPLDVHHLDGYLVNLRLAQLGAVHILRNTSLGS